MKKLSDISDVELIDLYYKYIYNSIGSWYSLLVMSLNVFLLIFFFKYYKIIFYILMIMMIIEITIYWKYVKTWNIRDKIIDELKVRKIIK